jgi:hypothetical protein
MNPLRPLASNNYVYLFITDRLNSKKKSSDFGRLDSKKKSSDFGRLDSKRKNGDFGRLDSKRKNGDFGRLDNKRKNCDFGIKNEENVKGSMKGTLKPFRIDLTTVTYFLYVVPCRLNRNRKNSDFEKKMT